MTTRNLEWGRDPNGKLNSAYDGSGNLKTIIYADFNFNAGDTYSSVYKGFAWDAPSRTINNPAGETETGGVYLFAGSADPTNNPAPEQRFTMPQYSEFWLKRRIFIPSNFYMRRALSLTTSTSISGWQVGDTVRGTDGASTGLISYINGATVYLNYPANGDSNSIWIGTLTNVTRSATATSTARAWIDNGKKHFVLYCDGYSSLGKSPTLVFGWRGLTNDGVVQMDFSVGVDGFGTGQQPNTQSGFFPFLTTADNGKWLSIIYHVKMATDESTYDGVVEIWRKRDDESVYVKSFTKTDLNMGSRVAATPTLCKFKAGYSFGSANSGYPTDTSFYESLFLMSSTAIDGVS